MYKNSIDAFRCVVLYNCLIFSLSITCRWNECLI